MSHPWIFVPLFLSKLTLDTQVERLVEKIVTHKGWDQRAMKGKCFEAIECAFPKMNHNVGGKGNVKLMDFFLNYSMYQLRFRLLITPHDF